MPRTHRRIFPLFAVGALLMTVTSCGRGSSPKGPFTSPTTVPTTASGTPAPAAAPAARPGVFSGIGRICGPGKPSGSAGRGLTATTIRVGTIGDPGSAAAPGLEQEYFDVADAFSKWCNAAGGINGRKIVVDKYDAKLFEGAAQILNACQKDFMLVGNGNAFDAVDVKPRLACKLGQIPSLSVSPEAGLAGLEVLSGGPGTIGGALRMNAGAYGLEMKDITLSARAFDATGHCQLVLAALERELVRFLNMLDQAA